MYTISALERSSWPLNEGNMPQLYLNNQLLVVCLLQPIECILAGGFLLIKKHINMNQSNHMNIIWAGYLWGFAFRFEPLPLLFRCDFHLTTPIRFRTSPKPGGLTFCALGLCWIYLEAGETNPQNATPQQLVKIFTHEKTNGYKKSYLKIWKDHKRERKENKNTIYSSNMQLMRLVSLNFPRISWGPPSMAGSGGYVSLFDLVKRETSAGLPTTTTLPEIRVSLDQAVRVAGRDWSNAYCQPTANLTVLQPTPCSRKPEKGPSL